MACLASRTSSCAAAPFMDFEAELGVELDMEGAKISTFGELADNIDERLS